MTYVIKLSPDHPANVMITTVAIPYDMKGYIPWDAIKYDDNIVDVSDKVSKDVEMAWIAGSMWGWHVPGAKAAHDYVNGREAMDAMIGGLPI
jgi:hypothetical protein